MSRATQAWDELVTAMTTTDPACQNDDRFVLDDQPAQSLKPICDQCPLLSLCANYGALERPKGGIWAGKRYRQYKATERAEGDE